MTLPSMDVPPQSYMPLPMLQLPPPLAAATAPAHPSSVVFTAILPSGAAVTPVAAAGTSPTSPTFASSSVLTTSPYTYPTPSTSTSSGKGARRRQSSLSTSAGPGSPGTGSAKERESHRRMSHSAIEKRRRERINDKIDQLKHLIPSCCPSNDALQSASMHQPLHKLSVLQAAIDYINQLHGRLLQMEPDLLANNNEPPSELKRIIAHVRQQKQIDDQLQDGHLSPDYEQIA
ncbi:helix-loop-helix DNA-binding domain-containing protein [Gongronella butleri]|nr:helix-loop-helix DNA-binding domain-containing protein [Gongronella butleri]